jgi:nicotinamidase-related amidase
MTTLANRPNTALLVIDVQNGVVEGARGPRAGQSPRVARRAGRDGSAQDRLAVRLRGGRGW